MMSRDKIQMETKSMELIAANTIGDTESRSKNTAGLKLPSSSGMIDDAGTTKALRMAAICRNIDGMNANAVMDKNALKPPSRPSIVNNAKYRLVTIMMTNSGPSIVEARVKPLKRG